MRLEMTQNTSHAVMAQRNEAKDSLDDFPTPPWATRALIEHVIGVDRVRGQLCWEPAANRRFMARPLQDYFKIVMESDIHDYGQRNVMDFLAVDVKNSFRGVNWIITNPPFNKAQQFIEKAQQISNDGVAMLVRTSFLESVMRYQTMFMHNAPDIVAQFSERVPMVKGRCDPKASTATSYAWLVWYIDGIGVADKKTILTWIPPCRKQLEREGDYEPSRLLHGG
jgi:hypothetical protein